MESNTRDLTFEGDARPLLVGLLAVQVFLGYEWLMSGLSKVLAGDFASGLAATLTDQAKGPDGAIQGAPRAGRDPPTASSSATW